MGLKHWGLRHDHAHVNNTHLPRTSLICILSGLHPLRTTSLLALLPDLIIIGTTAHEANTRLLFPYPMVYRNWDVSVECEGKLPYLLN